MALCAGFVPAAASPLPIGSAEEAQTMAQVDGDTLCVWQGDHRFCRTYGDDGYADLDDGFEYYAPGLYIGYGNARGQR
jgi:hypothetical protein